MSQAENVSTTRRSFVGGLGFFSSAPAAALVASAVARTDPAFAALVEEQEAWDRFESSIDLGDDKAVDAAGEAHRAISDRCYATRPTTLAGFVAQFERFMDRDCIHIPDPVDGILIELLEGLKGLTT